VVAGGTSKYWWRCPEGHDYEESLNNRSRGRKCPYCSHHRVIPGQTSLEAVAPDLAREWHPTLNGSLTPSMVLSNSRYTVWWLCKRGHAFPAQITARRHGNGCPYCSNKKVLPSVNDLVTTHPAIASQWHPTLNGTMTARGVVAGSARQIWWECPLRHIYRSPLYRRAGGQGCPFCRHVRVKPGFNDLATKAPQLSAEWDWTRNEGLSPQDVGPGSGRKAWWSCPQGHTYEQIISYRVSGQGCPYCSNRRLLPGDNDFQTRFPLLAAEWHPTKNGQLTPSMVFPGNQKRWWLCREGHEKYEPVPNRAKSHGCTRCPKGYRILDQNTHDAFQA
jgi:DNA-directed RNA polymerase subunit RPC12/RpoP